jgi:hypothetical protein
VGFGVFIVVGSCTAREEVVGEPIVTMVGPVGFDLVMERIARD